MSLWLYLLLFLSVFVSDAVYTCWLRAATSNRKVAASLAAAALPLIAMFQVVCLIEGNSTERVIIGLIDAVASFLATWFVMIWFPQTPSG